MKIQMLKESLGNTDMYIIDQFMKGNFSKEYKILDAGCGGGRNLKFLFDLGFQIEGCDLSENHFSNIKRKLPSIKLKVANLNNLPYQENEFDYIICNAVLHFANSEEEFKTMIKELHRVLKTTATLFIRMTSIFGIENLVQKENHQYRLPDKSSRFLLTNELIDFILTLFEFKEPLKTVNVNNLRCMSTLILKKK